MRSKTPTSSATVTVVRSRSMPSVSNVMSPLDRSRAAGYGLRMISHTDAFKVDRDLGQAHLNFVVLSCHAVPALKAELSVPGGAATVPPDHFKAGSNTASELLSYADDYHEELARSALITEIGRAHV